MFSEKPDNTRCRAIEPDAGGGWVVRAAHSKRAGSHHATEAQATAWTRLILGQGGGGRLIVRDALGRERVEDVRAW